MKYVLWAAILGGCSSNTPTDPPTPCAVEGVTGTLPGVTLAIRSDSCVYKMGQPARFRYEITTDASVPAIDVPSSTGCGSCGLPTTDPLSWIDWIIQGTSRDGAPQMYCLCDVGCCAPDRAQTIQPAVATASDVIEWSGHNWAGPSDTGMPEGAAFAPGNYRVTVTFEGRARGSVVAELPIEIVP